MAKTVNVVDIHVGQKLKKRRLELGMSQTELGDKAEITFQQIQKYEKGSNRISASRLKQLVDILDVPVSYFFPQSTKRPSDAGNEAEKLLSNLLALQMVRAFSSIKSPELQQAVADLVEKIAKIKN